MIFQETVSAQREEEGGGRAEEDGGATGLQPEEVSVAHAGGVGQEQELRGDARRGAEEESAAEEERSQRRRRGDEEKERVLQGLLQVFQGYTFDVKYTFLC